MPHFLLIGAGFSRNWGGWLASEAFEYLLGCPGVAGDRSMTDLLWRHHSVGGFESALEELQQLAARDPAQGRPPLMALQSAITRMFTDMNAALMRRGEFEFVPHREMQVGAFLARFDCIFTLNQDVLLEHFYAGPGTAMTENPRRWGNGSQLPGLVKGRPPEGVDPASWALASWSPLGRDWFGIEAHSQPIIKLHGSSNWSREDGSGLLIMGGGKAREIDNVPLLTWYAQIFEDSVTTADARLMVIGYGFRDEHINETIRRGVARGLKVFVIAPEGADIVSANYVTDDAPIRRPTPDEEMLRESLIGASRRQLREVFGEDIAEHNKVMRFFSA